MNDLIQELKNESIKSDIKVSALLRKAKIIASTSDENSFKNWIEKELNGYPKGERVPDYRIVTGEPKGFNPHRGWIPFLSEDTKTQEALSSRGVSSSIGELESLVDTNNNPNFLEMPYPVEVQKNLSKGVGLDTKFSLHISPSHVHKILGSTRNKLIDFLINLDNSSKSKGEDKRQDKVIFPKELIKKIPDDLKILCDDFNFNFRNKRPIAGILILRRILPLAIVRKFQKLNREAEIKNEDGDHLSTKGLLGKIESELNNKRVYKELMNYKILIDSSQHSYTLNVHMSDTEGAAVKVRIFLDDIF